MPPKHRLACQCFVRHEDILVGFAGDETLPKQAPYVTKAARQFTGGLEIDTLDAFLGYAVKVEEDAAIHFDTIAAAMDNVGNEEVGKLFHQLADFSRMHLAEARKRAAAIDLTKVIPPQYAWPDYETPERTALWAGDPALSRLDALKAALQGEKRGYEFYVMVAAKSKSPEVVAMAKEFVSEEAEHVKVLEAWITREEWAVRTALAPAGA